MKDDQCWLSLGNCKIKKQHTATHIIEWIHPKLIVPSVDKDVEFTGGICTILVDSVAVSHKAKHSLLI